MLVRWKTLEVLGNCKLCLPYSRSCNKGRTGQRLERRRIDSWQAIAAKTFLGS